MREEQHQPGILAPFSAVRSEELIHNRLCDIGEISELRLPEDEIIRCRGAEAILEAHYCHLGERAVVDLEGTSCLRQLGERCVALAGGGVVQHCLTMREGAALRVLAR